MFAKVFPLNAFDAYRVKKQCDMRKLKGNLPLGVLYSCMKGQLSYLRMNDNEKIYRQLLHSVAMIVVQFCFYKFVPLFFSVPHFPALIVCLCSISPTLSGCFFLSSECSSSLIIRKAKWGLCGSGSSILAPRHAIASVSAFVPFSIHTFHHFHIFLVFIIFSFVSLLVLLLYFSCSCFPT